MFELPKLPFENDSLEPHISQETINYHYGKHHQTYVDNLNKLISWTEYEKMNLEEIVKNSPDWAIFNNAAQVWNHGFYFESLTKSTDKNPKDKMQKLIDANFENFENFKTKFSEEAIKNFGSGWTWLILDWEKLEILNTSNAQTPLKQWKKALLTIDVWEHAYYIDYRNARAKYIENFWEIIDWEKVEARI